MTSTDELESQIQAQDCELEYWLQQADNYAEIQIPADDLRAIIARTYAAVNALPELLALREEVRRLRAMEEDLIDTFSYLGAGLPDQATHVRSRIEWAVDHHVSAAIQRAADVVERLSQAPAPFRTWGQVKTEILALKPARAALKDTP